MIDLAKIKQDLCCDDDFIKELLEQFITECSTSCSKIHEAFKIQDWQVVKGASHKMLSSTKILSLNELTAILKEIEIIADSKQNLDKLPVLLASLDSSLIETIVEIKPIIKVHD